MKSEAVEAMIRRVEYPTFQLAADISPVNIYHVRHRVSPIRQVARCLRVVISACVLAENIIDRCYPGIARPAPTFCFAACSFSRALIHHYLLNGAIGIICVGFAAIVSQYLIIPVAIPYKEDDRVIVCQVRTYASILACREYAAG